MSLDQLTIGRNGVCIAGRSVEPVISVDTLTAAIPPEHVESFRPLLPIGYECVIDAYQSAVKSLTVNDLTSHYTDGQLFFRNEFEPQLKHRLCELSDRIWMFDDFVAYAAGSDVDLMTHIVDEVSDQMPVTIYPGDWFGFQVGSRRPERLSWTTESAGSLACLCVPSVRNGHLTAEMADFLHQAEMCLLNINLYPTLHPEERHHVAQVLSNIYRKMIFSISFSRGFGMTASQLGVILIHRNHPLRQKFQKQWEWFTYFYNAIAAQAFLKIDHDERERVDRERRAWVGEWLTSHRLPVVQTGSYYVKSFRVTEPVPSPWMPLVRDGVVRMCLKPPQTASQRKM